MSYWAGLTPAGTISGGEMMLKTTSADAVGTLREAIATMPSEAEARSDFFVQWRSRTIEQIERLFPGDSEPARQFKELEFSPRRIAKNDSREEQLRLDAYLAGCAAARTLLENCIQTVATEPKPIVDPELQGEAQTPAVMLDLIEDPQPPPLHTCALPPVTFATPVPEARAVPEPQPDPEGVISGGTMGTAELCAPVRSSLSRVLGAWDKGDRDSALVLSAQLLAELTVLSRDERFQGAFEKVVNTAFDQDASETLKAAAPKCMWSLVAAMNEVMKIA
jgi:hypothetical protein